MSLSALIFNAEGALAETDDLHRTAYNWAFHDFGFNWEWNRSVYSRLLEFDCGVDRIRAHVEANHPDFWAAFRNSGVFSRIHDRKQAHYSRLIEEGSAPLRPGISRLITEAVAEGIGIAVVTPGRKQDFTEILERQLGNPVTEWVSVAVSRSDISGDATASDIYRTAIARLSVAPETVIAFDSTRRGTRAAAAAGAGVVATPGIYTSSEQFDDAWIVLSDLGRPAEPFDILRGPELPYHFISVEALRTLQRRVTGAPNPTA